MILDERLEFVDGTAIPGSAGTAALGDVIDLEGLGLGSGNQRDVGNGQPMYWYATVDVAGAGGTSIQLELVSSAAAVLSAPTTHAVTAVTPVADIVAGKKLVMIALPLEGPAYKRYLGIRAVVVGTFTDGAISSGLTFDPAGWKAYPGAED